jgi:hypothetical protein
MKCLDVGCGGGHVTLLMASMVGPEGKVTARTQMNRLMGWTKVRLKIDIFIERDLPDKLFSINCRSVPRPVFTCRLSKLTM